MKKQDKVNHLPADGSVEMLALAGSEAEAMEIAKWYQIELLSFSEGVAVYSTDRPPAELIALGNQNGYPKLSVNRELHLF